MSADGAAGADTGGADGGGDGDAGLVPNAPLSYGTIGDVREALGLDEIEDLPPDDRDQTAAADEVAAKRDAKGKFTKGEAEGAEALAKTKDDAKEDDDVATVKAIEARAKARRLAREAGRREREAKARPAASAAKPAEPAPAAKPAADLGPVEKLTRDVLAQIERMATGDAETAAAQEGAPAPDTAERKAQLDAITAKLDEIKAATAASEEGKAKFTELQEQVRALESDRIIRRKITEAISDVADEVPTLLDASALRAFNKANGTKYADAVEMIGAAAARYFEKFKKAPDLALMAKRIEAKLKGASPEQTETVEKPTPKSKTISRNDGAPPAARGRDDERSFQEAEEDFKKKYGLD